MPATAFPDAPMVTLLNAGLPGALREGKADGAIGRCDISIADGRITAIAPAGATTPQGAVYDADGGLVLPALVDLHTHLDKGHIWPRRQNPDGSWQGALMAVAADREALWSARDVERRMDFALRAAYAHGTAAIRTHLDSAPPQHEISWTLFDALRERWAGRIELQAVALVGPDIMLDRDILHAVARRARQSGGVLGGAIHVHAESRRALFNVVETAGEFGLDLDLHCDETLDPSSRALHHFAEAVLATGYAGKALAGHCCVLSVQDEATAGATIELTAKAGIGVVSLPMCNLYLQDRHNGHAVRTPRYRGVTLLNELKAAGVSVALASDNTRDPFYAYGDLDGLEVFREGARIAHFDHPQADAMDWLRAVTTNPADLAGFRYRARVAIGAPADLLVLRARTWTELNARPQADRIVLRAGRPIDTSLPDYRELDDLME